MVGKGNGSPLPGNKGVCSVTVWTRAVPCGLRAAAAAAAALAMATLPAPHALPAENDDGGTERKGTDMTLEQIGSERTAPTNGTASEGGT